MTCGVCGLPRHQGSCIQALKLRVRELEAQVANAANNPVVVANGVANMPTAMANTVANKRRDRKAYMQAYMRRYRAK